jgi:DNA-binding PadR family transcriptional regulator
MKGLLKLIVLKEIESKDQTGYQLMNSVEEIVGKKPSPGSMYPLLKELVSKNLISSKTEGKRIIYHLTKKGSLKLKELEEEKKVMIKTNIKITNILTAISGDLKEDGLKCENIILDKMLREKNNPILRNFELIKELCENFMKLLLSNEYMKYEKDIQELFLESNNKLKKLIKKINKKPTKKGK